MYIFLVCIVLFLVVLAYLAMSVSSILKWRNKAETEEFAMRREFLVMCGFAEGILSYIPSQAIKDRREAVLGARNIQMMAAKGEVLSNALDNVENLMFPDDRETWSSLKKNSATSISSYNQAVILFNKKINNMFIRALAKKLKVKEMKVIEKC